MNAIEVKGLTKTHPSLLFSKNPAVTALKNISFQVDKGAIYTILGPNGAGKTTLIQVLAGLLPPTKGEIKIAGIPIQNRKAISKTIGLFTSDEKGFWKFMSGWDNLTYFAALQDLIGHQAKMKIAELVKLFEMKSYIYREMHTYSNGMKQRLLLARALLHDPAILLLDEPITHLDPIATREFHFLLRNKLVKDLEKTIFISTHQLEEAQEISDMLGFLFEGELLWEKPADLFRSHTENLLEVYMETVEGKNESYSFENC